MSNIGDDFEETLESGGPGCNHHSFKKCIKHMIRFKELTKTNTSDWTNVPILSKIEMGELDDTLFEFDKSILRDYEKIEPFYDSLTDTNLGLLLDEEKTAKQDEKYHRESCQFCGHATMYKFFIKNDMVKKYLIIGSHCIKKFENVDTGSDDLKIQILLTLQTAFDRWCDAAIKDISKNHKFYGNHSRNLKYKNLYFKLTEFDKEKATKKEFVDLFRKSNELGIGIPHDVTDIIKKRTKKKTGLDEFFWS